MRKPNCWVPVAMSYAVLAWFVYFVVNPLCYNIFQQPAFVLTSDFFWTEVSMPGGLSYYLQMFIDQFTMFRFWGTLFLVAELFATAFLADRYVRKVTGENNYVSMLIYVLAVGLMCVAWIDVKYAFAINMKALLLIAALNVNQIFESQKWYKYMVAVLALFVYVACGSVPLYIFALCCVVNFFLDKGKPRLIIMSVSVALSAILPFLVYKFMLPINAGLAFYQLVPQKYMFVSCPFNWTQLLILVFIPIVLVLGIAKTKLFSRWNPMIVSYGVILVICAGSFFLSNKADNKPERVSYKMAVAAYHNDWDEVISYVKDNPALCTHKNYDRNVNFYYDMALAKKNQLGSKMFNYPQLLGIDALFLDSPVAANVCLPTAMLYYNMGFITNALHYAFEAQTSYPSSHYTMRYVIDCLLIIGDYTTASKFLAKYEKDMLSRKFVESRKVLMNDLINKRDGNVETEFNTDFVRSVRESHPTDDFYMQNRQNNALKVLMANPQNPMASQYLLCSALLQNDLDLFVQIIMTGLTNLDNNNLPKIFQEAIILYWATAKDVKEATRQINISSYIKNSFSEFVKIMSTESSNRKDLALEKFPKTYWTYYYFDSPKVTGVSLNQN